MEEKILEVKNSALESHHPIVHPMVLKIGVGLLAITAIGISLVILLQPEKQVAPLSKNDPLSGLLASTLTSTSTPEPETTIEEVEEVEEVDPLTSLLEEEKKTQQIEEETTLDTKEVDDSKLPLVVTPPKGVLIGLNFMLASGGETKILSYPQEKISVLSPLDVVVLMKAGDTIPFLASPVFEGQEKVVLDANTTAVATLYTSTPLYTSTITPLEKKEILLQAIGHQEFISLKEMILNRITLEKPAESDQKIKALATSIINELMNPTEKQNTEINSLEDVIKEDIEPQEDIKVSAAEKETISPLTEEKKTEIESPETQKKSSQEGIGDIEQAFFDSLIENTGE